MRSVAPASARTFSRGDEATAARSRRAHVRFLAVAFVMSLPLVNPYLRGDGHEYYAYIRSLVIDGDLQFENEYRRGDPAFRRALDGELVVLPTGYRRNPAAVGASMLWAPFFLVAHGAVLAANVLGADLAADGYSWPYRGLCALGTAGYSFLGLLLARAVAARYVSPSAATLATVGIWFASSLPVYMYFLPFHVHALAAFTVALFVWLSLRVREQDRLGGWLAWGCAGGLAVATYYLNGLAWVATLLELGRVARTRQRDGLARRLFGRAAAFAAGAAVPLVPTLVVKAVIHGSPFRTGYADGLFYWSDPRLLAVGFSPEHGAFLWTPVLVLALLGLMRLWPADRWFAVQLWLTTAAFYYTVAAFVNWHGNSSYGSRFLVALTVVFVVGLALLVDRALGGARTGRLAGPSGRRTATVVALLVVLVAWNVGLMFQWGTNIVPNRGPVDFAKVARNQVTVVPRGVVRFALRYLRERDAVVREVEERDLRELPLYRQER